MTLRLDAFPVALALIHAGKLAGIDVVVNEAVLLTWLRLWTSPLKLV